MFIMASVGVVPRIVGFDCFFAAAAAIQQNLVELKEVYRSEAVRHMDSKRTLSRILRAGNPD